MFGEEVNYYSYYQSPVGWLKIQASDNGVTAVCFSNEKDGEDDPNSLTMQTQYQLQEYFEKKRTLFDLPFQLNGTHFQQKVWNELQNIPYGRTISYLELSKRIGDVKAIRAVGHANGQNPLPIIIPCHRVIGSDGSLTGFSGGLWRKKKLLQHEGILPQIELEF